MWVGLNIKLNYSIFDSRLFIKSLFEFDLINIRNQFDNIFIFDKM